jgi:hypothetical protein
MDFSPGGLGSNGILPHQFRATNWGAGAKKASNSVRIRSAISVYNRCATTGVVTTHRSRQAMTYTEVTSTP